MNFVILTIKGFILGCTAIIPGISIGTMALVLNVYEKVIAGFNLIFKPALWKKHTLIDFFLFFTPLAIGLAIAMVIFATLLKSLLSSYPSFVHFTFLGIILKSIPYIYKEHIKGHLHAHTIIFLILGACVILFFSFSDTIFSISYKMDIDKMTQSSILSIVAAIIFGVIGSGAGLIPGISGSFILLIIGYYTIYLTIIKDLILALLIPLILGQVLGLVLTSLLLKFLFDKYPSQTYATIFGLVTASLIGIFPWEYIGDLFDSTRGQTNIILNIVLLVLCLIFGMLLTSLSTIKSKKNRGVEL